MFFHVLTLFPDMIMDGLNTSILGKAMERGYIQAEAVNIRDYTLDKHLKVDDYLLNIFYILKMKHYIHLFL